jgi:hypothetical protein
MYAFVGFLAAVKERSPHAVDGMRGAPQAGEGRADLLARTPITATMTRPDVGGAVVSVIEVPLLIGADRLPAASTPRAASGDECSDALSAASMGIAVVLRLRG